MQSETKRCLNCNRDFVVDQRDFDYYNKIKISSPTWCPECRMIRRMVWRNERSLYSRSCNLCNVSLISIYTKDVKFPVYCNTCYWSDKWDSASYAKEFDIGVPLLTQFLDLFNSVPNMAQVKYGSSVNSEYSNITMDTRNVYLSSSVIKAEDVYYSYAVDRSRDIYDSSVAKDSEIIYESISVSNCNKVFYSEHARDCIDSVFIFDAVNCQNCFMSSNIRNRQYLFRNQQLNKTEYLEALEKENLGSEKVLTLLKQEYAVLKKNALRKYAEVTKSDRCTGDELIGCSNTQDSFYGFELENSRYVVRANKSKEYYDVYGSAGSSELICEQMGGHQNYNDAFFVMGDNMRNSRYTIWCHNVSDCFACVGLRNKQYCILNKQYTKEEYESLVPKLIEHTNTMLYKDGQGRGYPFGEFFPSDFSPFAYNETVAQEYFPLTKETAETKGFRWKDSETRNYQITIKPSDLPDNIKEVGDGITREVIGCAHADMKEACNQQCTTAFKVIPKELEFYKKHNLSLPRLCPNCRHYERLAVRNPLKLWHRKCMKEGCENEFETSYAPEREEIVYCERCYLADVV